MATHIQITLWVLYLFSSAVIFVIGSCWGYNRGRSDLEKEAISHGFGTFELGDREGFYEFEWHDTMSNTTGAVRCLPASSIEGMAQDLGKSLTQMEKS